jgi:hypothetical protein
VNRGGVVGVKGCWCESVIYGGGFLPIPGSQVAQRNVALDLDGFDGDNLMAITWTRIEKIWCATVWLGGRIWSVPRLNHS